MNAFRLCAVISGLAAMPLWATAVHAAAPDGPVIQSRAESGTIATTGPDGLMVNMPTAEPAQLMSRIRRARAHLQERADSLSRYVDENGLGAKDVIITVVMPGGLLYAAYRKAKLHEAQQELVAVNADVNELGRDLLVFQAATELRLARVP